MSRLDMLLSVIGLQSSTRPPVESPATGDRYTRQDALAELSFATNSRDRIPALCALLERDPSLVTPADLSAVRVSLAEHVVIYALALRRPFASQRLAAVAHAVARAAIAEHIEWEPCNSCNGRGWNHHLSATATGVVERPCERCSGARRVRWSDRRRARTLGLSLSTAQNRWLELVEFAISLLAAWSTEGVSAIHHAHLLRDRAI